MVIARLNEMKLEIIILKELGIYFRFSSRLLKRLFLLIYMLRKCLSIDYVLH